MVLCVRDFSGGLVAKILHSQYRGSGSIPGQGTRSRMLQQRLKILHGPTKIQHSQKIKIFFKKLKKKNRYVQSNLGFQEQKTTLVIVKRKAIIRLPRIYKKLEN